MNGSSPPPVPWEIAIARSWRKLAVTFTAALAVTTLIWDVQHPDRIYEFVFQPEWISNDGHKARRAFLPLAGAAALLAALISVFTLRQARRGVTEWSLHRELLVTSLIGLPVLTAPSVEFDHAFFVAVLITGIGLALAFAVSKETKRLYPLPDLSPRQAWVVVCAGFVIFVGVIGFISHWRFITFHAELCDASWEIGAVAGILRHGYPTVSVAAWLYDGQTLPAPYFNNHVPLIDYLFVPFYAVYPDGRTVCWTQALFMGTGAFGAHLLGRRWLGSQVGGALVALLYLLNPSVQSLCLHDIHANVLVVPTTLLAVGFMESGRYRVAALFALLTAICREETPLYAAGIGLYWMLSGEDRRRFRIGLGILLTAIVLQAFFALYLMPHFGGEPRWEHFNLYFDRKRSPLSMIGAVVLNPMGAAFASTAPIKLDYLVICLVPLGGLALCGWRMGFFALPALLLLVPASGPTFFTLGINYATPLVPVSLLMGVAGLSYVWRRVGRASFAHRAGIAAYVLTTALLANHLYGNIASKSYKFEFGQSPLRRQNQRNYYDTMGYIDALPPFGPAQKAMWEVIDRVPHDGPVLTTWAINPQLATHDVALVFGYSGGTPPAEERVRYIVLDKLPPMQVVTEPDILRLRQSPLWRLKYENQSGLIFERKDWKAKRPKKK